MLPFSFEDRHPEYCSGMGYGATNEEPAVIKKFVKPFSKGLSIGSGGEVVFLNILPKTQDNLVVVDHSYISLKMFCTKALLLVTLGPVATKKLLMTEAGKGWAEAVEKVAHGLPLRVANAINHFPSEIQNIRREWFYADIPSLKKAVANFHKVRLIHGDLLDASDEGPFDFLYLSNALEHSPRSGLKMGSHPDVAKMSSALLKEGSSVLWVQANGSHYGANDLASKIWALKQREQGYRTSWFYNLSQKDSTCPQ